MQWDKAGARGLLVDAFVDHGNERGDHARRGQLRVRERTALGEAA